MFNNNDKVAAYSAVFLAFLPVHAVFSGKILTDVFSTFFVILTTLSFWEGFENGKKMHRILFGIFLALSILARYTLLWMIPIFFVYLVIKYGNLSFLRESSVWFAVDSAFIILLPWFIYGFRNYSGNPLGPFIHGARAAPTWGGIQPWYFYFQYSLQIFSVPLLVLFLGSLLFIAFRKENRENPAVLFLLLWFVVFFVFASFMSRKEDRFVLPLIPPFVMISALFLENLGTFLDRLKREYKKIVLTSVLISVTAALFFLTASRFMDDYRDSHTQANNCFLESNRFLETVPGNSVVITDESPVIYYYSKKETHFYPNPFSIVSLRSLIDENYKGRPVYVMFTEYDMPVEGNPKNQEIKAVLDSNFGIVYSCPRNGTSSLVYEYGAPPSQATGQ